MCDCVEHAYPVYAYNPSVYDKENLFVKLSPYSFCSFPFKENRNSTITAYQLKNSFRGPNFFDRYTVWLQRGRVRSIAWHAEDARPFVHRGYMCASSPGRIDVAVEASVPVSLAVLTAIARLPQARALQPQVAGQPST